MRAFFRLLLALYFLASPLWAGQVRIATWNICNYLSMSRLVDGVYREDYPKPEAEKLAMHSLLLAVQPDILLVQEMGNVAYLRELQADLAHLGLVYEYAVWLEAADPLRHIAVLSRKPFREVYEHKDLWFSYSQGKDRVKRGLLELVFEEEGFEWTLYGVHLKSQWAANSQDPLAAKQREREATTIRNLIRRQGKPYYIIAGDFNDHPNSQPLRRFLQCSGEQLAKVVPARDSRAESWTCYYKKEDSYTHLDYILISPEFSSYVVNEIAWIVDQLPESLIASDHRMLVIDLAL